MSFFARLRHAPRKLRRLLGRPGDLEDQIYFALVRRGDTILDIGANKGDVALLLSRLAGAGGRVVAFEPVWPVYERLCAALRKRSRRAAPVVPVPCGMDRIEGIREIGVPNGNFGQASMAPGETWSEIQRNAEITRYDCAFSTLDGTLAARRLPTPDFLKIDVEGAELYVLEGGPGLLSGPARPLMVLELFAPWEMAFGYGPWDVLSLLAGHGYSFLFVCPEGLVAHVPTAAQPFPPAYERGYNVIAYIPDRHADRVRSLDPLRAGAGGKVLSMTPAPRPNLPRP